MKLHITYLECSDLAKAKVDKVVVLSYIDNKSVNVKYSHMQKVPLLDKYIPISLVAKVRIDGFENGNLFLTYNTGNRLDAIISGVFTLFPDLMNMNIVEMIEGQKAVAHLMKVDKVRGALEKINILDMCFDEVGVNVEFALK